MSTDGLTGLILPKLAFAAFAMRALVPVGYMPDITGGQLLFTLCPSDPSWQFVESTQSAHADVHAHHDVQAHHGDPDHDSHQSDAGHDAAAGGAHDGWEHCPFGAAVSGAALVSEHGYALLDAADLQPGFEQIGLVGRLALPPYSARAPPVL